MKPILAVALAGGLFLSACAVPSGGALDRAAVEAARADLCEGARQTLLEAKLWAASKPRPDGQIRQLSALRDAIAGSCDENRSATIAGNLFITANVGRVIAIIT
ncbi:MAG: hypothetical protein AAF183_17835 [Pseudomonadota bacterium]